MGRCSTRDTPDAYSPVEKKSTTCAGPVQACSPIKTPCLPVRNPAHPPPLFQSRCDSFPPAPTPYRSSPAAALRGPDYACRKERVEKLPTKVECKLACDRMHASCAFTAHL